MSTKPQAAGQREAVALFKGGEKLSAEDVVRDYRIAYRSRQMSTLARGEVMLGRAMFGIFGDGKELAQVALARAFEKGDVRSGYYRDQTLMLAL
ncbi:MAG: transketolase, partial [Longimicrobiales bacterium]